MNIAKEPIIQLISAISSMVIPVQTITTTTKEGKKIVADKTSKPQTMFGEKLRTKLTVQLESHPHPL